MNKGLFLLTITAFCTFSNLDSIAKTVKPVVNDSVNNKNYDYLFDNIKKEFGVKVYYKDNQDFFPSYWKNKTVNPKLLPISLTELKRFPKIINQELSKYSKSTINNNLKGIYLAKMISFYSDNLEMGATNSGDGIYLTANGVKNNYSDQYIIHILHHELSSILLRNGEYYKTHFFPQAEWESWHPRGFSYNNDGNQANREKKNSLVGNEELYQQGLLSEYSLASFEEDYNVYSGMIFSEPQAFYELKNKYPIINEKFKIWLNFYNSIDKKITEENLFKDVKKDK